MLILSDTEQLYLSNLLKGYFDNISDYLSIANRFDILRLLRNNSELIILTTWATELNLIELGQTENTQIVWLDNFYRTIKEFDYTPTFGLLDEHIDWLNTLANGQLLYLRLNRVDSPQIRLAIVINELPLNLRKELTKRWVSEINWRINNNTIVEVYLTYPGAHTISIYYLASSFNYNTSKNDIINHPGVEIYTSTIEDYLTIYKFKEGFYLFMETETDEEGVISERWLKIDNVSGGLASNFRYINNTNYLGSSSSIQISLNLEEATPNYITSPTNNFKLMGDLVPV